MTDEARVPENERACAMPRADTIKRAAAFLMEHAEHAGFRYNTQHGQLGVFAGCRTCCADIHYPDWLSTSERIAPSADVPRDQQRIADLEKIIRRLVDRVTHDRDVVVRTDHVVEDVEAIARGEEVNWLWQD